MKRLVYVAMAIIMLLGLLPAGLAAQVIRIDQKSQWETWSLPQGVEGLRVAAVPAFAPRSSDGIFPYKLSLL